MSTSQNQLSAGLGNRKRRAMFNESCIVVLAPLLTSALCKEVAYFGKIFLLLRGTPWQSCLGSITTQLLFTKQWVLCATTQKSDGDDDEESGAVLPICAYACLESLALVWFALYPRLFIVCL